MIGHRLRLVEGAVYDTREEEGSGNVVSASFFVDTVPTDSSEVPVEQRVENFILHAMTESEYAAWYLERSIAEESRLEEDDVSPLIVPDMVVAVQGLVGHVERTYLDPSQPHEVNKIRSHLVPITPDMPGQLAS
jgi:hypothetical protein